MTMCTKWFSILVVCSAFLLAPCDSWAAGSRSSSARAADASADIAAVSSPSAGSGQASGQEYVLGTGDRIRLTVYGETDLSGEYEIGATGIVALPLVGDVHAAGQPVRVFEQAVRSKLSEGYLRDPRVSAQVVNYRPFFILGEVSKPGSYPYVNGMTVLNAVALAGGYSYRADKSGVTLTHAADPEKKERPVPEESAVLPGDIIRVPERFF